MAGRFDARDLVGASSYSPLPLAGSPVWVEAGDRMPEGCDCVIDPDFWSSRPARLFQVSAEAIPGQGVRRIGGDIAEGSSFIAAGRANPRRSTCWLRERPGSTR